MLKFHYRSGALRVTDTMLRFKHRSYKIAHIENLVLRRPLFAMGLTIGLLVASFAALNRDILFDHELVISGVMALLAPLLSWPFGTLTVHSRVLGTNQGSITWFHGKLALAKVAVEVVLSGQDTFTGDDITNK